MKEGVGKSYLIAFAGLFLFIVFILSVSSVQAFEFNGTVKDIDGNPLNNSLINITIRSTIDFSVVGYNFTTSNESGWFNISVAENAQWMYEPKITKNNNTFNHIQYIGQKLHAFPQVMLTEVAGTTFFLRDAGTINLTAINASGARVPFTYIIKDKKLGYQIENNWETHVNQAIITLSRDRNYSIMIFPNESMPVSFDWNNFSASQSYDLSDISSYNFTTKTLHYQFNTTMELVRVSGYINYSGISGWNNFHVIPYLMEPGNMIHSNFGTLPYNLSEISGETDFHNATNGFYNISLPATLAETSNILLFATARNGSNYYGGFRNISGLDSDGLTSFNFSHMAGLFGSVANISQESLTGQGGVEINTTTAQQTFRLVNSTNSTMTTTTTHIETTVDYSELGAIEFTWMSGTDQGEDSTFTIPLLNSTGIKEMNVFASGGNYAPTRKSYTASQLGNGVNITLNSFNPNAIDEVLDASDIIMALYTSNSTCDVPNPGSACLIGSTEDNEGPNAGPMQAMMGGGKISFRMGIGNISVHYVNVDMMASGPPDALFDSSTDEDTGNDFESALRFGSGGPTIYDYVLISIPYTEGSSSQTGLNEDEEVNVSIPLFYNDNWNVIWNSTANRTSGGSLAGNNSHYSTHSSEWETLMGENICGTNVTIFNSTNPCYIDKTNNRVWIRLPHFSGTGPSITGNVVTATPSSGGGSSGGGSSGGGSVTSQSSKKIHSWAEITPGVVAVMKDFDSKIGIKEITLNVNNPSQNFKITITKHDEKPAEVSVAKSGKIYQYLQIEAENIQGKLDKANVQFRVEKTWVSQNNLNKDNLVVSKFDNALSKWNELTTTYSEEDNSYYYYNVELDSFSYFAISEKSVLQDGDSGEEIPKSSEGEDGEEKERNLAGIWILIIVIIVLILSGIGYKKLKK